MKEGVGAYGVAQHSTAYEQRDILSRSVSKRNRLEGYIMQRYQVSCSFKMFIHSLRFLLNLFFCFFFVCLFTCLNSLLFFFIWLFFCLFDYFLAYLSIYLAASPSSFSPFDGITFIYTWQMHIISVNSLTHMSNHIIFTLIDIQWIKCTASTILKT